MVAQHVRATPDDQLSDAPRPAGLGEPGPDALRALQRSAGNRATRALVAHMRGRPDPRAALPQLKPDDYHRQCYGETLPLADVTPLPR
jgi:hypothetical protein